MLFLNVRLPDIQNGIGHNTLPEVTLVAPAAHKEETKTKKSVTINLPEAQI